MSSVRLARFVPTKKRIGVSAAAFAVLLILAVSIGLCAQPKQNPPPAKGQIQDANSIGSTAPIPQTLPAADATAQLTVKKLQARKKQISESQELSDDIKARVGETYDKAIAQLKLAAEHEARKQDYSQRRQNAPANLEKTKELLVKQTAVTEPEVPPDTTLTQAEQFLTTANLNLEEAKKNATNLENEPKKRAERGTRIPDESNNARQELIEIKAKLTAAAVEGDKTPLAQADQILLLARQRALESQIAANTEELLFYDAGSDLIAAQRDLATRQTASAEKLVEFWKQNVSALRQREADAAKQQAIRAKEETRSADPAIQAIAEKNAELAELQASLVAEVQKVVQYSDQIDAKLAVVKKDFAEMRTKVDTTGRVTDAMGMIMLGQRDKLPNIGENRRQIRGRPSEISLALFEGMERDREWSDLSDLADELDAVLAQIDPSVGDVEREAIKTEASNYYESQRKTLRAISKHYLDYATKLANLDTREREYVDTVEEYADFIDAKILWVRSSPTLRLSDLRSIVSAVGWLLSPVNWQQAIILLLTDLKENILTSLVVLLIAISLIVLHPRAHGAMETLSGKVHQVQTDSFVHTFKALLMTLFLAATWPVILLLLQWRLFGAAQGHDFSLSLATGLRALVPVVFMLGFLWHFTMPHGLARDHLRIHLEPLPFIRRLLAWYFAVTIPATLVFQLLQTQQTGEQWYNSAGRLFFLVGLLALAVFLIILLRPTGPFMGPYLKQKGGGWIERLRYFWYPLCIILPGISVILGGMGYFYAARQLYEKLVLTIILILLAILIKAMFARWLTVAQRRLALLERRKREAAEQESQIQQDVMSEAEPQTQKAKAKDETSIFQISQQTRRLIDAITVLLPAGGIWYVWNDVLPALGALAETRLWRMGADQVVTFGSLSMAFLIAVLTVIVTRNVPGLLEIIVLRRLPLDRGVRFAITTLFRYTLAVIGIVLAFGKIGIGWSKVQWLIAAMTVGLGFGLQEIFANFVSGLIILFEQPVRVDDVVTIGDVTGTVSKIRIRATTIRRWDQRELIVPNKEFITGRLINWTLSDNVLRQEFSIGIAYGSDIGKAEKILYEVADANPMVLKDPKPMVIFRSFGDNSLNFDLRLYISGMDKWISVWHQINCAIDTEFRKAGIEIAFPQCDLHIRSMDPGVYFNTNKPKD